MRVRESLNRMISTPIWDKSSPVRKSSDGSVSHTRPKRDENGIILCRNVIDQEACRYADKVRDLRQHEYDNASLYTDREAEIKEQNEKSFCDFVEYFEELAKHQRTREGYLNPSWVRTVDLVKEYLNGKPFLFRQVNVRFIENVRDYFIALPTPLNEEGHITLNTAQKYFAVFKATLKKAFIDGFLTIDYASKVKGLKGESGRRECLTKEELNVLAKTPCEKSLVKRAALFSALTGLRISDVRSITWSAIQVTANGYRLNFRQKKTHGVEYMPISEQAFKLCGERQADDRLIFEGLDSTYYAGAFKRWIAAAGITRKITFPPHMK